MIIVYDIECIRPPVPKDRKNLGHYLYANGWDDYRGMGIATMSLYNYSTKKIETFIDQNFEDILLLKSIQSRFDDAITIAGFNIKHYDNNMLRAHDIEIDDYKCYDIFEQLLFAVGIDPTTATPQQLRGYGLKAVLKANFGDDVKKIMKGEDAPYMWQDKKYNKVIEYCEQDVTVEKLLLDTIFMTGGLINPKTKQFIRMALPMN